MVFSSLIFIFIFLPVTIILYYISPKFLRNFILLIVSLIFYAWGEPVYIFLMMFSMIFNYVISLLIHKYNKRKALGNTIFISCIIVNLGILGFFKYYNFIISNINTAFSLKLNMTKLALPIGISFYTFQIMSYVIDVYLKKVEVQKNIISFCTYVTMFPQLVAGPIVQYSDVAKQLDNRKESLTMFGEGAEIFIIGLAKKVLLANNIGVLWSSIKATPINEISVLSAWIGIIAFTFQIYFDFSGYSDMAIGLGKIFGFEFMQNFNYPYTSQSVTEFWRRWHISLGSWFREYVYIPLGGNKKGRAKQYRNIFIVWLLTGLWHGANWNFVFWGLYFGIFVTLEKVFILKRLDKKPKFIRSIYTLLVVIIGWVLFEFENMGSCIGFLGTMFGFGKNSLINTKAIYYLYTNIILFVVLGIFSTPLPKNIMKKFKNKIKIGGTIGIPLLYLILFLISIAYLVNETYNPFLYFKF